MRRNFAVSNREIRGAEIEALDSQNKRAEPLEAAGSEDASSARSGAPVSPIRTGKEARPFLVVSASAALALLVSALLYPGPVYVHPAEPFLALPPISTFLPHPWPRILSAGLLLILLVRASSILPPSMQRSPSHAGALMLAGLCPLTVSLARLDPAYILVPALMLEAIYWAIHPGERPRRSLLLVSLSLSALITVTAGPWLGAHALPLTILACWLARESAKTAGMERRALLALAAGVASLLAGLWLWQAAPSLIAASERVGTPVRPSLLMLYNDGLVVGLTYPAMMGLLLAGAIGAFLRRSAIHTATAVAGGALIVGAALLDCFGRGGGDAFAITVLFGAPIILLVMLGAAEIMRSLTSMRALRVCFVASGALLFVHYHLLHIAYFPP